MTNETITTDTQNTFYQTVNELEEAMKTQNYIQNISHLTKHGKNASLIT